MSDTRPSQIKAHHLDRLFVGYPRQSTLGQLERNPGSTAHQRGLGHYGLAWGWAPEKIRIYDGDLGRSGRSEEDREDLQEIKELIRRKEVGCLMVSSSSRLHRNVRNMEDLMALCRATDTLLAIEGSILDLSDSTHRLMIRMRANVDVYENEQRAENFEKGRRAKARAGKAVSRPPTGYVRAEPKGAWDKDPEQSVRDIFDEMFRQLDALGSVMKVLRYFRSHHLQIPTRDTAGDLSWREPSMWRIYHIATNPAYAGYYVFGRKLHQPAPPEGRRQVVWNSGIVVAGHHPPYIQPADWHHLQQRLEQNRFPQPRQATPHLALCERVVCGACGRRMQDHYHRTKEGFTFQYHCSQAHNSFDAPLCWRVPGPLLDVLVGREVVEQLVLPEIEDVIAAAQGMNQGYDAACRQRKAELARAEYEAARFGRLYEKTDPENQPVLQAVGADWRQAIEQVEAVKRRHGQIPLEPPLTLQAEELDAIRQFTADLPALWQAPTTTIELKRELVRTFLQEVRISASTDTEFGVDLVWAGGAITQHRVLRPQASSKFARMLKAQGKTNREIAAELNRLGLTTRKEHQPYTPEAVQAVVGGPKLTPWPIRAEALRPLVLEYVRQDRTDAQIATDFNRRGVEGFRPGQPWTRQKVRKLRDRLGIHPKEAWHARKRALRASLAELAAAGWSDPKIAEEFNRRRLMGFQEGRAWTGSMIGRLRAEFGIPAGREGGARREALRNQLLALIAAGRTDAAIAEEFNRQQIPPFTPGTAWTRAKIITLRQVLGIPRSRGGIFWPASFPPAQVEAA